MYVSLQKYEKLALCSFVTVIDTCNTDWMKDHICVTGGGKWGMQFPDQYSFLHVVACEERQYHSYAI